MELYALQKDFATLYLEAIENASAEDRAAAILAFGDEPLPSIIGRTEGSNEATIKIIGPLSPDGPSPLARFFGFGGTGYKEIIEAANSLKDDPSIDTVTLVMNTPGGMINGMDQASQAIKSLATKKNVPAENHGMIASAGYYLATSATKIIAKSPIATIGSIGVIKAGYDFTDALSRNGIKKIKIISSNAPNKQADPATPQGLKVHQNEVDAMERVFIRKVAEGRNTTDQDVIANFGKGGMLISQDPDANEPDALKVGMIDSVVTQVENVDSVDDNDSNEDLENDAASDSGVTGGSDVTSETQTASDGGEQQKVTTMNLEELKADNPAIFAQAVAVGVEQGVTQERKRVDAHITMGEASGDMELAVSCIKDGTEHDAATNAKYMASQMNKNATVDRGGESEGNLDTDGAGSDDASAEDEQALAEATAAELGVEI